MPGQKSDVLKEDEITMRLAGVLKVIFILSAAVFLTASEACAVSWRYDLDGALKDARNRQVPVMADFYTAGCGWCTKLDKDTYTDQRVNELSREFICVKVDAGKYRPLSSRYKVSGYPTIIFFDTAANEKKRIVGYVDANRLANTMAALTKKSQMPSWITNAIKRITRPEFELTGILYDPAVPKAIINDNIVGIGDTVKGAEVLEITKKSVKLSAKNGRVIELKLPR